MIKFDLICENQHIFEASFDDSNSFEKQKEKNKLNVLSVIHQKYQNQLWHQTFLVNQQVQLK